MTKTLKVDAHHLAEAVAWIAKFKGRSYGNSVLSSVQVSAVLGAVRLRHTDYEMFHECLVPAEGGDQVSVLVDPGKLAALFKGRQYGVALVEVTDTELAIELGGRTVKLRGTAAEEFPAWPVFTPTDKRANIAAPKLARALTSVGVDDKLPMLTGVRFEDGMMVSTDSFRLSRIRYADSGFTTLVPAAAIRAFARGTDVIGVEVGRLVADANAVDGGMVRLSLGGRSILARVLDADFPAWRQHIPTEEWMPLIALIRRDQLLAAIGSEGFATLTFPENGDTITVACSDEAGDVVVEQHIDARMLRSDATLPYTIRLNSKRLAGCLKGIAAGALRFMCQANPTKSVMMVGLGDADLHMLMPIRMPG